MTQNCHITIWKKKDYFYYFFIILVLDKNRVSQHREDREKIRLGGMKDVKGGLGIKIISAVFLVGVVGMMIMASVQVSS